jgi:hypothetical protein
VIGALNGRNVSVLYCEVEGISLANGTKDCDIEQVAFSRPLGARELKIRTGNLDHEQLQRTSKTSLINSLERQPRLKKAN